jgi:RimJ/RimL family protein N-acetyltransferase
MPAQRDATDDIPAAAVVLRPTQPDDLPALNGMESPFNDFGPRVDRASVPPANLDDAGCLAVLDGQGKLAGDVSWHYVRWGPNRASRCPMIGIGLLPAARGRGLGRAAQRALAELFFTHTAVNRVEAHTDVDNIAEQRALQAAGFTREGRIRGAQWRDGAYRDGYLYAIVRSDMQRNRGPLPAQR